MGYAADEDKEVRRGREREREREGGRRGRRKIEDITVYN